MSSDSRKNVEDIYPLSPLQQGMLFHALYAPRSDAYAEQFPLLLEGPVDAEALVRAFRALVARHAALRTAFVWENVDRPLQVVYRRAEPDVRRLDWSGLPEAEWRGRLDALLAEERRAGFDPGRAPLVRLSLARIGPALHLFLFGFHHILFDGWSFPLLLDDLEALYRAERSGRPAALPPPPRYRDYIAWLLRQDAGRAEAFWRGALAGFTAPTPLPLDRGGSGPAEEHGMETLWLDSALTGRLHASARERGVTLNTLVQGAWGLLLARSSGEEEVVFGATVSGRPAELPGVERMVGLFINTLPVRLAAPPSARVGEWLGALQAAQAEVRQHDYAPLNDVQGWSGVPHGRPLFESVLVFENYPVGADGPADDGGLRFHGLQVPERTNYALTLVTVPGEELELRLAYDARRFDAAAARRILALLRELLAGLAADPGRTLGEVPWLTPAEARRLAEWSGAGRVGAGGEPWHRLFSARAARNPSAAAVVFDGGSLTYAELDARSDRLARRLASLGVRPESRVAVCMERGAEMVAAVLAVLKAGGAYVPVDPDYPAGRVRYLLEDSGAPVVLTQARLAGRIPATDVRVVVVDGEWDRIASAEDVPLPDVHPENAAYVIYTSGSTGRPKGVVVTHASLVAHNRAVIEELGVTEADRVLQFASFSFDISVEEIFPTLLAGGTLVPRPAGPPPDAAAFARLIAEREITLLNLPTAYWHAWVAEGVRAEDLPPTLRLVTAGGERPQPGAWARWQRAARGRVRWLNGYGPTEATVTATFHETPLDAPADAPADIPLGRPLANSRAYVLDAALRPVPAGVAGELCLGGAGVARGYLGRPGPTAAAFVPDPFAAEPGARMYRTGDRARWRDDGVLEFIGRADEQVKVRGHRVEPGEVEAALREHPAVHDAAVAAREDAPGAKRLVAYVVGRGGSAPSPDELRAHLLGRLPAHLVPSAFVALDALPLTPGGKVDRRALPAPEAPAGGGEGYVAPRGAVEEVLARVWAQVLGVERVGVHDNFFALGGDSILSIQVVSRAAREGVRVTPRQVFEEQTVAALAAVAGGPARAAAEQGAVAGEAPLTPIQAWFFAHGFAEAHHWNLPVMLESAAPLDADALRRAFARVLEHHDALRLRFRRVGSAWRQVFAAPGEPIPFELVDLSDLSGEALRLAIETHAAAVQASLDLERGPLMRAVLYRGAAGEPDRLLWTVHHLAVDTVSWRVLLEDLETAYGQAARGEPVALPAKTTSFREWAHRLAALAAADEVRREAEWWLSRPWERAADLPADHPAGENTEAGLRTVTVELDEAETRALLQEVPPVYGTRVDDVLLAALARSVSRWTGAGAVALELEGHGREELFEGVDLSRTVGWFTAAFPVVLEVPPGDDGDLLRAVKEQLRAIPRKGLGWGLLRHAVGDERLAALPEPRLSFNYLGRYDGGEGGWLRGTDVSPGPAHAPRARRAALVDIAALVEGGRLRVTWMYAGEVFGAAAVERAASDYADALRGLVAHCRGASRAQAPAGFPLAALTREETERVLAAAGARPGEVEDVYPLTPLQQGMLFHARLTPESDAYVGQAAFTLRGGFDADAYARAWEAVVGRHPALRTAFVDAGAGGPVQVVLRRAGLPVRRLDLRGVPRGELPGRLRALAGEELRRGIDPARAPLLRLTLARLADAEWRVVLTHHHLVFDGWSAPRLYGEVDALYAAYAAGRGADLPAPRPYRDYVAWLARQDAGAAEAFWRRALAGFARPTPLPLAGAAAGPGGAPSEFGEVALALPAAEAAALGAFAREGRITLNTLFLGAWALLLARHAGEDDVLFGTTVSGRPADLPGVEEIVGMMINTIPARVGVRRGARVLEWLREVQRAQLEARQYEHAPLTEVRRWSGVPGDRALFESLYVFENYPALPAPAPAGAERGEPDLEAADAELVERTNYPLAVAVVPRGGALELRLTYDAARFTAGAARRLAERYRALAAALAESPERAVGEVAPLTEGDRRALAAWSRGPAADAPRAPFHRLFEEAAARRPEAPAIRFEGKTIPFAELNARANRLARRLRALGVGAETVAAVSLERSPELVVALLAVNKAGGAFLPVDPRYPAERRRWMLEDSGARVVLTHSSLLPDLPSTGAMVIALDAVAEELERESDANLPVEVDPGSAAYVIFTSGSTGRPKGVVVPHLGIGNLAEAQREAFGIGPGSRVLQFASFSFDAAVAEAAHALLNGACLVMGTADALLPGPGLLGLLCAEAVTVATLPPSVLAALPDAELPALATVVAAGEAVGGEAARRWGAGRRFVNAYGPTETTVCATLAVDPAPDPRPAIGGPMPGATAHVLDAAMHPVPPGAPGELYVGGVGVARGYLGRPGLTAERFVPDPFSSEPGARLYRTGDRVRWREDGQLDFLGRVDEQVKVRGFRVEPGEIEAALREHPAVRDAVAAAREDVAGDPRLVGYVVPADGAAPAAEELRAHLAARLPEPMVPGAFVVLDALPLTPSGKVDRRALPAPGRSGPKAGRPPSTPTEEALAELWGELLGVERVGADDSFFLLGGHSLLAMRLVAAVLERFEVELPLRAVFEAPTLAGVAARVDAARDEALAALMEEMPEEELRALMEA
ncbi:MAG TPA: amino acid adenylation domain-containing protein [Longimicrobium sp.]